ncbi:uncharacterized protein RJT20DRAFT_47550 [Scheffersomyces xylosifermentans]|uniref:uncharacterized protein n=1 Tax=Scheffersomyces xylosifermentans TaxID=1304137 RepID=UPI00315DF062
MLRNSVKLGSRTFQRFNATAAETSFKRTRPRVRDLVRTPVFKSIFLTLVFGSAVVDLMKNRKEFEGLVNAHEAKFTILEEIIEKLKKDQSVDITRDLKIANTLTRNKYNTVTDIELDEQLENFLKMAEAELETDLEVVKNAEVALKQEIDRKKVSAGKLDESVVEESVPEAPKKVETKKFL